MRSRVVVVAGLGVLLLGLGPAGIAQAKTETRDADANTSGGTPQVSAGIKTVSDSSSNGAAPRRRGGSLKCQRYNSLWFSGVGGTAGAAPGPKSITDLEPGDQYGLICTDASGKEVINELRTYNPAAPGGPAVDPEVLAEQAVSQLDVTPPVIELSPKAEINQVTQLATWMWVTNWAPDSATASVPGVSATVTASPRSVTWDMGNGDQVVCDGPGTPYDFERPAEGQSSDCSYTYRHSSTTQPGGVYQVSATMSYDVSWSAAGAAGGGSLPAVAQTTTLPVRVIEIQVVEGVGNGGR